MKRSFTASKIQQLRVSVLFKVVDRIQLLNTISASGAISFDDLSVIDVNATPRDICR